MNYNTLAGIRKAVSFMLVLAFMALLVPSTGSVWAASPSMVISASANTPGTALSISGSGFSSGETVRITGFGADSVMVTANGGGSFSGASLTIPSDTPEGSYQIQAVGQSSRLRAVDNFYVGRFYPMLAPSAWYLKTGQLFTLNGTGFMAGEKVTVSAGGVTKEVTTDGAGSFTTSSFSVPFNVVLSAGLNANASGQTSLESTAINISLGGHFPYAWASNYYVTPGSTVTFGGEDFAPGEIVQVKVGSTGLGTVVPGATGGFSGFSATVPFGVTSPAEFTFTGQDSGAQAIVPITIAPFSGQVTPSTWYTMPGSGVSFSGQGFVSGESVGITLNGEATGSTTVNSLGNFSVGPLTIPFGSAMAHFTFMGQLSGISLSIDISLGQFYPYVALNNYYSVGGTPVTVTGGGFGAGENVAITFGGANLGTATADSTGALSFPANVPFSTAGTKTVQAQGVSTGAVGLTGFTQAPVWSSIQLGSYAGAPGTAVTFIGSGYLPNEPMEIRTDRTGSTVVHTFTANSSGGFMNAGYAIPATFVEGPLTFTITGTHSLNSNSIIYYVTGN